MSTPYFRFKQFTIFHDRCAMKVGTDGVLLGCWAITPPYPSPQGRGIRILDIGTGSGLIARMLMQRFPEAKVEGIDIDEAAVEQARRNGVNAYLSSLQEWPNHKPQITNHQYDLVVSNPPYFQNSLKNPDKGRELARHTDSLSYEELLAHSERLLTMHGQLAIILPANAEQEICKLAARHSLYLTHVTRVYSKESKPPRRVLLQFEKSESQDHGITESRPLEDTLVLEDDKGGRSAAYQELAKDFYL
ncbi:MAG: methyltransferase [Paludibacteraceae bacterium]|nr:methyltransferase [Paludibacteraceae bacterium]